MLLFNTVNTGCREQEVCQLRVDWEVDIPQLNTSVFILPESLTKTSTDRLVVLNSIAQRVVEARRGSHPPRILRLNPQLMLVNSERG